MSNEHLITPPPELRREWREKATEAGLVDEEIFAAFSIQWGADQELKACCEWLIAWDTCEGEKLASLLREGRRPQPPSLKEQALEAQQRMGDGGCTHEDWQLVRRALEALPND
jgi:hypothetical protein